MHFAKLSVLTALVAASSAAAYRSGEGLYAREAAPYAYDEDGLDAYLEARDAEANAYWEEDDLYERDLDAGEALAHALQTRGLNARGLGSWWRRRKARKAAKQTLEGKRPQPPKSKADFDAFAAGPAGQFGKGKGKGKQQQQEPQLASWHSGAGPSGS